ncbi:uncharacterized protein LTR77_007524 [Saxophila tyrrhenica]|uniref:Uncharacterized protein n=1 Tax=Saxophila tyrrhenica TaxID=1690608 RepID=A0AAV9P8Z1_9PEZI|nr:hypothetical protein LTR77_007524 [Saxophila tyrrhenica]
MPQYPGMNLYKGKICHSSAWDESFDATGKAIATIGDARLAEGGKARRPLRSESDVDWGRLHTRSKGTSGWPYIYISEEAKEAFKDEETYLCYRKKIEDGFYRTFEGILADSTTSSNLPNKFTKLMKDRLDKVGRADLLPKLTPNFPPHCRRLTPGPGYLESLPKDNVTLIQTPIERFYVDGIVTTDGVQRPVDAVICSTGANTDCILRYLSWQATDVSSESKFGFPYSYLGTGVPGFPNMSFILGPNPAGPTGTLVNSAETQIAYIAKMLRKISLQGIRTMTPSKEAADDFVESVLDPDVTV